MSVRKILSHFKKFDHWTFLVAVILVAVNIFYKKAVLDLAALIFLLLAFGYDIYEEVKVEKNE